MTDVVVTFAVIASATGAFYLVALAAAWLWSRRGR